MSQDLDLVIWGYQRQDLQHFTGFDVAQLSAGCYHSAILTRDGGVYTWGDRAEYGMLGHGCDDHTDEHPSPETSSPKRITALTGKKICQISSAGTYMAAVEENGTLYTWGTAVYGQHGNVARCFPSPVPMQALRNIPVRRVACGRYHVGAVTDNGLYTWGDNSYGQLGHGVVGQTVTTPTLVNFDWDAGAFDVAVGWNHTAVISCSGRLYTFGCGKYGVLGHGNENNRTDPAVVKVLMNHRVCQVTCGGNVTTALTDAGAVYVCGEGAYGQLGLGPQQTACLLSFVRVTGLASSRIIHVANGWGHTAAIDDHGHIWIWGYNCHQQVAHDDLRTHFTPILIKSAHIGQSRRSLIAHTAACGYYHTMVFSTPEYPSPTSLPSWRLAAAEVNAKCLEYQMRSAFLSQVAGALAVSTQKLGESCEQLTASNKLLCVRNTQLTTENQTLRKKLELLTGEMSTTQLNQAMTQLRMERLLMDLPPMSPFGADAAIRLQRDLAREIPLPSNISTFHSIKLRIVGLYRLACVVANGVLRGMKIAGQVIRIPQQRVSDGELFLGSAAIPVYQQIYEIQLRREEIERKRTMRNRRKFNNILYLGYVRHRTTGLRDLLVPTRLKAAVAASSAWALHRQQAAIALRQMAIISNTVYDRG